MKQSTTDKDIFRRNIQGLSGYTPGEQPQQLDVVKLNTNENPYPPSPSVMEAIAQLPAERLRRYPDPVATSFRNAAAKLHGVNPDCIVATNGGDDALTILTRACLDTDDLMVTPTPTYPLYRVLSQIQGCRFEARPFTASWDLPDDFMNGARLAFLPNPNSPTGTLIPPARLVELAENSGSVLIVDETYAEFSGASCLPLLRESSRLIVVRSLSKSHSLAGLRFGYIVANPPHAEKLSAVKDSYNCDALSIAAATAAIEDPGYVAENVAKILATRKRLDLELSRWGFEVTPSRANFVWARHSRKLEPIYQSLKEQGVLVRHLKFDGYGEGLRISVGTEEQVDRLLLLLSAIAH